MTEFIVKCKNCGKNIEKVIYECKICKSNIVMCEECVKSHCLPYQENAYNQYTDAEEYIKDKMIDAL